jgi:hypothetical protein
MNIMNTDQPVAEAGVDFKGLLVSLETARRHAIENAALADSRLDLDSAEQFERIAHLQMALMAVREEIAAHMPKVGFGSEEPIA